ncbi:MAG: peptidase M24, structural domain-containing protein [Linnemannia gamsii]|nr:MAG: peptidase M24, structural domain-containing protein [Linnemannia gamsii]
MLSRIGLKYPARLHCQKVASFLSDSDRADAIILARGTQVQNRDNTDTELDFRQESNFLYLTGVQEADFYFLYDIPNSKAYLIAPEENPKLAVWKGPGYTDKELLARYDVDFVHYISRRLDRPAEPSAATTVAYKSLTNPSHPRDPKAPVPVTLLEALVLARINKSPIEIALSRESTRITSDAHRLVMKSARPGMFEYQLEALFRYECARQGAKNQAYLPIVGTAVNAAYLHYTRNDTQIKDGDLVLIDAACEADCYGSDVTRTFPVNGRFSKEQADIYNLVLEMQTAVINLMEQGVDWREMATLSQKIGVRGLKRLGILKGDDTDLIESGIIKIFYPHGLGHLLGLNVHDDGLGLSIQLPPPSSYAASASTTTTELEPGMLLTVEPGIYFNPAQIAYALDKPYAAQYLDEPTLKRYMAVGGVRIEDVVLVLPNGQVENITTAPKQLQEVERIVQEGQQEYQRSQQMDNDVGYSASEKKTKVGSEKTGSPVVIERASVQEAPRGIKKRVGVFKKLLRAIRNML